MQSIYLDNAATSFPKPAGVSDSMKQYLDCVGATINRSVYGRAQEAGLETLALREVLARLFHFPEPATHVVLTPGATFGLNLVIKGLLRPGDHCIVSGMEHNAVMRPLQQLEGVEFDRIPCDSEGFLQHGALEGLFRPNTRLVVLAHASNVCGSVQDAAAVGAACARHGCFFLLDGAQTAGHYPIDFAALRLSALAVPGHKGLLGPSGIGALLLGCAHVTGCDIDPKAPEVAAANAALNGFYEDRFTVCAGDILADAGLRRRLGTGYDLVLANIVADVIIPLAALAPAFLALGGTFVCSGIIDGREDEVAAALTRAGFTVTAHDTLEEWHCFTAVLA